MLEFTCPCLNVKIQKSQSLLLIDDEPASSHLVNVNAGSPSQSRSFGERVPQCLDSMTTTTTTGLGDVFSKNFANSTNYFLVKTSMFFADKIGKGSIDSDLSADFLAIKHRQLVGQLATADGGSRVALYKCVNCNCFTHCVLASPQLKCLKQRAELVVVAPPTIQLEFLNENSNMSGSVESLSTSSSSHLIAQMHNATAAQLANPSSQSSWQASMSSSDTGFADSNSTSNPSAATATTTAIQQRVVIVSSQMIFDPEQMGALRSSPDFSRLFELVLASSCLDQPRIMEIKALNLTFSSRGADESIESYVDRLTIGKLKNSVQQQNEEAFKQIFISLVKAYARDQQPTAKSDSATQGDESGGEKKLLKMKKQRKASFRGGMVDTGSAAVDSVFELEEIDHDSNELYQKQQSFLRDNDDGGYGDAGLDNNSDDNDLDLQKSSSSPSGTTSTTSILKKRNSNVGAIGGKLGGDSPIAVDDKMAITRQISIGKKTKSGMLAKYSFSLPRDIPFMGGGGHRLTTLPINKIPQGGDDSEDDENVQSSSSSIMRGGGKLSMMAGGKENTLTETGGHEDLSFMINDSVNMNDSDGDEEEDDDDDDDELFKIGGGRGDKHAGVELQNMGQAISNLASSIVQKDGRELFGGVPSRRIPINSISKSCLD